MRRAAAQGADRSARRLHLLRADRRPRLRLPRSVARHDPRVCCSARRTGPPCAASPASSAAFATPLGDVLSTGSCRGRIASCRRSGQRRRTCPGALAGSAAALPADVLDDFTLLPFAVGMAGAARMAEVLDLLWGGPETLILISSDLSHFHPYADGAAASTGPVGEPDPRLRAAPSSHEQACGATPINGLLLAPGGAAAIELLDLRNSGDTAGDRRASSAMPRSPSRRPACRTLNSAPPCCVLARGAIGESSACPPSPPPGHAACTSRAPPSSP
jgi:hypothetical protein